MRLERDLANSLMALFSAEELRALVGGLPGGEALASALPGNSAPLTEVAEGVVEALARRGRLPDLLVAAAQERPNGRADFAALLRRLAAATPPPGHAHPLRWKNLPNRRAYFQLPSDFPSDCVLRAVATDHEGGAHWAFHLPGHPRAALERSVSWADLDQLFRQHAKVSVDRLLGALTSRESGLNEETLLGAGAALGIWLFTEERDTTAPLFRSLFGTPHESPSPVRRPARLRLALPSGRLRHLPWAWLSWKGHALVSSGWTVEHSVAEPARNVSLANPCRTLLVIPEAGNAGGGWHRERVATLFRAWGDHMRALVRVVGAEDALLDLLDSGFRPQIVYLFGRVAGRTPIFRMDLPGGGSGPARLGSLIRRLVDADILFLNVVWDAAGESALPDDTCWGENAFFLRSSPFAAPLEAAEAGQAWLERVLSGCDPLVALHDAAAQHPVLTLAIARTAYERWRGAALRIHDHRGNALNYLDRHTQRAKLRDWISGVLLPGSQRVAAVLAMGDEHQLIDAFGRQLRHDLGEELDAALRVVWRGVLLTDLSERSMAEAVLAGLEGLGASLEACLVALGSSGLNDRSVKREGAEGGVPLLVLDLGIAGPLRPPLHDDESPLLRQPSLRPVFEAWLPFVAAQLASICPVGVRVLTLLRVAAPVVAHGRIRAGFENVAAPGIARLPLDPLDNVPREDIRRFLANNMRCSCTPEADSELVSYALFARAHRGQFRDLVREIDAAEQSGWRALETEGRALKTEHDATQAPDEDY